MRSELNDIQLIEQYLLGTLNDADTKALEERIQNNASLKELVEAQKLVMQASKRKALRKDIAKASSGGGNYMGKIGIGTIILLATAAILYFNIEKPTEETHYASADFHGLNTWLAPDIQTFSFDASEGATIEGKDGILIVVPDNAFVDSLGNTIAGNVDFELVEALKPSDMLAYNLTTQADDKPLETGGMFYTNASQNGKQISINKERPLYIEVPTSEKKPDMMAFKGEVTPEGNINWKDPQKLQKFLVPIDFALLDFLPERFEDEVRKEPKNSRFYLETKEQIDSLYYSLSYCNNPEPTMQDEKVEIEIVEEPIIENRVKVRQESYDITDEEIVDTIYEEMEIVEEVAVAEEAPAKICCGIDPITVKTIRTKPFANSFIATREFEERIKILHKQEKGEQLVQKYIHNLGKNLWEIDSAIALQLRGSYKNNFLQFAKQRLTNIKDAELYQKRLTAYYNQKKSEAKKALAAIRQELQQKDAKEIASLRNEIVTIQKKAIRDFNAKTKNEIQPPVATSLPQTSVANSNTYAFQWFSFGWTNIDCYLKLIDKENKKVQIIAESTYRNTKIYQWLNTINNLTPIITNNSRGTSVFPAKGNQGWERMQNTQAIAIARNKDNCEWATVSFNPYETDSVLISLAPISFNELKQALRNLDIKTDGLIKNLKTTAQLIEEENQRKEEQAKRMAEIHKIHQRKLEFIKEATKKTSEELAKKEADMREKEEYEDKLKDICFCCYEGIAEILME